MRAKAGSNASARVAALAEKALGDIEAVGAIPHDCVTMPFSDAPALARAIKGRRIAIVYVTAGFAEADVEASAAALTGVDVLSASAVADRVRLGIVLGFDLVSGKPKLLVHLAQAKRQRVDLSARCSSS